MVTSSAQGSTTGPKQFRIFFVFLAIFDTFFRTKSNLGEGLGDLRDPTPWGFVVLLGYYQTL